MDTKKNHTPEAIALAAGLLGQAKGDIAAARRAAGDAHVWLCSIDASYKPEPVAQAAPVSDGGKAAELQRKLDVALEALQAAAKDRMASERAAVEWKAKYTEAMAELDKAKLAKDAVVKAAAPLPRPAPAAPINLSKAPAADEFAHLPPAMREFARNAAARKLEID